MISLFETNILDAMMKIDSLDDNQSKIIYSILSKEDRIDSKKAKEWMKKLNNKCEFKLKLRIFEEDDHNEEFLKEVGGTHNIPVEFTDQAEMYAALLEASGKEEGATKITDRITNDYPALINNVISQSDNFMKSYNKISELLTANDEKWTIGYMNSLLGINSNNDSNLTHIKIIDKEDHWMSILDENAKSDSMLQLIDSSPLRFNNLLQISPTHLILYAVIKKRLDFGGGYETNFKNWIFDSLLKSLREDLRNRPEKTNKELENMRKGHSYIRVIDDSCFDQSTDIQNMIDSIDGVQEEIKKIDEKISIEMDEAMDFAINSPLNNQKEIFTDVYDESEPLPISVEERINKILS